MKPFAAVLGAITVTMVGVSALADSSDQCQLVGAYIDSARLGVVEMDDYAVSGDPPLATYVEEGTKQFLDAATVTMAGCPEAQLYNGIDVTTGDLISHAYNDNVMAAQDALDAMSQLLIAASARHEDKKLIQQWTKWGDATAAANRISWTPPITN